MDRWSMMVLGAGNRLALAAGLSDGWNLSSPTRVLNLDTIVSKLLNFDTIVSKSRIGVKWYVSLEVCIFWESYVSVPVS